MHKLIETDGPRVLLMQEPNTPFIVIPATVDHGILIAMVVEGKTSHTMPDGRVVTPMVAFLCPDEVLPYIPEPSIGFVFTPHQLGPGAWVWRPEPSTMNTQLSPIEA